MNDCKLSYIPKHLHWDNKPIIPFFYDTELLFWRLKNDNQSPFSSITLSDVSVNRSGIYPNIISKIEDALWNITNSFEGQKYKLPVATLSINILDLHIECKKIFTYPEGNTSQDEDTLSVEMYLLHDPIPCNYSHSMFVFFFENNQVTFENYKTGFGKKDRRLSKLRDICRDELQKMIIAQKVSFP